MFFIFAKIVVKLNNCIFKILFLQKEKPKEKLQEEEVEKYFP